MRELRKFAQHFSQNPEGKRPLGRPRRRWKDSIKPILKK